MQTQQRRQRKNEGWGGLRSGRAAVFVALLLTLPLCAEAGGLYVADFGTPDMGTAGAGAIARGRDASTALFNSAAMTRLDSHQAMMAAAPGISTVHFDTDRSKSSGMQTQGNNGGEQGGFIPLVSSSYVHHLSDRFRLGMAVLSVSGAALDANSTWSGRQDVTKLSLFTLTFFPSAAFKITDTLSLGAGASITYGKLDWELKGPPVLPQGVEPKIQLDDLDDWAVAPIISLHWEPMDNLRFGLVYQGETELDLEGDFRALGNKVPIKLELPLAQAVRGDFYWGIDETWAVMGGFAWEDWSTAESVTLSGASGGTSVKLGFKDTWKLRAGVHYRLNEKWLLQTGLSYDSSPLDTSNRIAALPLDQQWRVGVGTIHDLSDTLQLGLAFEWVNLGKARLNSTVRGEYERNEVFFLVFNLNWKKLPWDGMASF